MSTEASIKPRTSRGGKRSGAGRKAGATGAISYPKVSKIILADEARKYATEAIGVLVTLMRTAEKEETQRGAANDLLDRGFGKAPQHIDVGVVVKGPEWWARRLREIDQADALTVAPHLTIEHDGDDGVSPAH